MNSQTIRPPPQESIEDSSCNLIFCMKRNGKLFRVMRVLLCMAETDGPVTIRHLACMSGINLPVLRRLLAGLQYAGFVCSSQEIRGLWLLMSPPSEVTLKDIHEALGIQPPQTNYYFSECLGYRIGKNTNPYSDDLYFENEVILFARNLDVSLKALSGTSSCS